MVVATFRLLNIVEEKASATVFMKRQVGFAPYEIEICNLDTPFIFTHTSFTLTKYLTKIYLLMKSQLLLCGVNGDFHTPK